jgi:hypothetical protein
MGVSVQYNNYLRTVATRFSSLFDEIAAQYNFDYGDEFEIVLCRALRTVLPQRFGICRGFVISADSTSAGDDIVIYDRDRFPTLRLLPQNCYDRKEYIPVEAVCAYIEAKHTLSINGQGSQSLFKACSQVAAVKRIPREGTPLNAIDPYAVNLAFSASRPNWPSILNPMFGAVFARRVRSEQAQTILDDPESVRNALIGIEVQVSPFPDLIVAGDSNVILPFVKDDDTETITMHAPFRTEELTKPQVFRADGLAFAIGVCTLLYALDTLRLGRMPWPKIISEGLGL